MLLVAHPSENASSFDSLIEAAGNRTPWMILVGPEGGFTDEELAQTMASGGRAVSCPGTVFRSGTAGLYFMSVLQYCLRQKVNSAKKIS